MSTPTKYKINDFLTYKENSRKARVVLETEWNALTDTEKESWMVNSPFNSIADTNDPTGKHCFFDYFMGEFGSGTNSNSAVFTDVQLGAGSSNGYDDRASRTWAVS